MSLIPGAVRTPPPKGYMTPPQVVGWKADLEVDSWIASSGTSLPNYTQENTMQFRTYSTTEALRIMEHLTLVAKTPYTVLPATATIIIPDMTGLMLTIFTSWLEREHITVDRVA